MTNMFRSLPGDRPLHGDGQLEAMLSGRPLPENSSAELQGVSELLTALRAAPVSPAERSGQAPALGAYREKFVRSRPNRPRRRRPAMISTLLGAKLGAALAAGVVSFGAVGAAAATGSLPAGLQDLAHTTVGAPSADHGKSADHKPADHKPADHKPAGSTAKTAVGPDATGQAAFGLCTAWASVQNHGQAADKSVAFRNLASAAGGADGVTAYCATVPHPGASPAEKPAADTDGKPASHLSDKPATHPAGKSASHLSDKPASHLSDEPSPEPSHSPSGSGASHRP